MKIIVLCGSPNRNGSTNILVESFVKGATEAGHDCEVLDVCHVREHVPEWWGVIKVELDAAGNVDFYILREAAYNPKVKDKRKITILWRTELNRLLEKNGLPKYREKSKLFVQDKLLEKVTPETLWPQAYEELFERDYNTIGQEIEDFRKSRRRK